MFDWLVHAFKTYRVATGVYLFSTKEKIAWDITILILLFLFFVGILKLSISSYYSFVRVFFGDVVSNNAAATAEVANVPVQ